VRFKASPGSLQVGFNESPGTAGMGRGMKWQTGITSTRSRSPAEGNTHCHRQSCTGAVSVFRPGSLTGVSSPGRRVLTRLSSSRFESPDRPFREAHTVFLDQISPEPALAESRLLRTLRSKVNMLWERGAGKVIADVGDRSDKLVESPLAS